MSGVEIVLAFVAAGFAVLWLREREQARGWRECATAIAQASMASDDLRDLYEDGFASWNTCCVAGQGAAPVADRTAFLNRRAG